MSAPENTPSIEFEKALSERYLAYALSTIMSRSLPDVRDGLKPVHRRLIYAMHQLKLNPGSGYKKSARVVGDVMGKFHPHGDGAIYDALVRLAQEFSVRYPLIDGQGNFGNVDGDNAAAMRYTEARLTDLATHLLEDIDRDCVDFRPTYDGEEFEPLVFPAAFPNILANGANGIAVGMATSIPPHNLDELCEGLLILIDNPNASVDDLLGVIEGPDFPTGGIVVEHKQAIKEIYEKGKGSLRVRARWHTQEQKGGTYKIVVTQIPYQVGKSKLIEKIADLLLQKKLPLLNDVIDESADDIRIVFEPKNRLVDPKVLMQSLFRATDLEVRIQFNMNVLQGNVPKVLSLKEMLVAFLDHKKVVLIRRSNHRLNQIAQRLNVLKGYLIAYLNLDEVIKIIRDADHPREELMARFQLNHEQAESILNMRLRSLRKLQEIEIRTEHDTLEEEQGNLNKLLSSDSLQWQTIKKEIKNIQKKYSKQTPLGARRTTFEEPGDEIYIPIEAVVEREDVTVICSKKGWIRSLKGHTIQETDLKYKEADEGKFIITTQTTDKLLLLSSSGRFYTIGVDKLPGGRGHGEPLSLFIDLPPSDDIVQIMPVQLLQGVDAKKSEQDKMFVVLSSDGRGFAIGQSQLVAQTKQGKQILNLNDNESAVTFIAQEKTHLALIGENRKLLIINKDDIPVMNRSRGVSLQKYRYGEIKVGLSDVKFIDENEGLTWIRGGKNFVEKDVRAWLAKRGSTGRLAPTGFPRTNKFS